MYKKKRTRTNQFMVSADEKPKSDIGVAGRKSESRIGENLASRLTKASGASDGDKGDIETPVWNLKETYDPEAYQFRMECKSTQAQSLAIQRGWLHKIAAEAQGYLQTPALVISFTDNEGRTTTPNDDWVAIPLSVFKELFNEPT